MKKIIITLFAITCIFATSFAQVPKTFGYQTVVRANQRVVQGATVGARLTILKNSATGTSVYCETQNVTTSSNGVATFEVGRGTVVSGVFADIEWLSAKFFIKAEIDPAGGTNYTQTETMRLNSVPYAMFADKANYYTKMDSLMAIYNNRFNITDSLLNLRIDSLRHIDSLILIGLYSDSVFTNGVGRFATSDSTAITFSPANLWFRPSDSLWKMPDDQWDTVGQVSNSQLAAGYTGWINMLTWATSGYNGIYPVDTSLTGSHYGNGLSSLNGTPFDWGMINEIQHRNSSFQPGTWRAPKVSELEYILQHRPNAANLMGFATVNGIHGMVLLPDDWPGMPHGCKFVPQPVSWDTNVYNGIFWTAMENRGAVFLPAEGYLHRSATPMHCHDQGWQGFYWTETSSSTSASDAYYLDFGIMSSFGRMYNVINPSALCDRLYNHNVRLVKDIAVQND